MKRCLLFCMVLYVLGGLSVVGAAEMVHVVQSGETMYGIARNYDVSVEEILKANKISDGSRLKAGQKLIIPLQGTEKSSPAKTKIDLVTVAKGDTLFGLARKYGMTLDGLRALNGLTNNSTLKYGQKIKVQIADVPQKSVSVDEKIAPVPVPANGDAGTSKNDSKLVPEGSILDQQKANARAREAEWPVTGEVYTMEGKFPGVAIKSSRGSAVHSLVGGKVIYTGSHSSLGNVVFVQGENGFIYIYGGNESVSVQNGTRVKKGDELGKIGQTPGLTESQAYFTVWKDGVYVDPVQAPR